MFTLGIPLSQYRRTTRVLGHERSTPVDFESIKQDDDFYIFSFDMDYDGFKDIVLLLKRNGITTIGADSQLTERNIMKLSNLLELTGMEDSKPSKGFGKGDSMAGADDIIDRLKQILKTWETKEYASDKERYEEYFMDIDELVEDWEENRYSDLEDVSDIDEKSDDIEESLKLKDFFINVNVETLMVKLGGDEKTELRISNQTDSNGAVDLSNVTLEFKGEKYENLEFKFEEVLEDHDNEGKDALFVAESDDKTFEVEVNIDANYEYSNIIDDVEWRSLETFPKEVNEQGCSEQEIEEGTCGHNKSSNGQTMNTPGGIKGIPADKRTTLLGIREQIANRLK